MFKDQEPHRWHNEPTIILSPEEVRLEEEFATENNDDLTELITDPPGDDCCDKSHRHSSSARARMSVEFNESGRGYSD